MRFLIPDSAKFLVPRNRDGVDMAACDFFNRDADSVAELARVAAEARLDAFRAWGQRRCVETCL